MTNSHFESSTADPPSRGRARLITVLIGAGVAAVLAVFMVGALELQQVWKTLLVLLAVAASFAAAIAVGWWTPRWIHDRDATVAWLLPRLVLIAFALSAIAATSAYRPSLHTCPSTFSDLAGNGIRGGELLYASMRGDTFVCTYNDLSGSL